MKIVAGTRITPVCRDPSSHDVLQRVLELVAQAGMNARIDRTGGLAGEPVADTGAAFAVDAAQFAAGQMPLPEGLTLQNLRGRRGLWSGHQPALDVLIVGIDRPTAGRMDEAVTRVRALVTRLGRSTLCLATNPGRTELIGHDCHRQSVAQTAEDLVTRPDRLDVIVAGAHDADILAATARAVSGAQCGLPRARRRGHYVCFDDAAAGPDDEADAGAMIAAATLMLRLLGAANVARRIDDAFVATLEAGIHPPAQRLALPYARQVPNARFADEVRGFLGTRPRRDECRSRLPGAGHKKPMLQSVC